jgi:hypothetical protein
VLQVYDSCAPCTQGSFQPHCYRAALQALGHSVDAVPPQRAAVGVLLGMLGVLVPDFLVFVGVEPAGEGGVVLVEGQKHSCVPLAFADAERPS